MARKTYITDDLKATFVCDKCDHAKVKDVSRYADIGRAVTVKCTCRCGHTFSVTLEKRKLLRKECSFMGRLTHRDADGNVAQGRIRIINVSRGGLRIELMGENTVNVDDQLDVEFRLDDETRSEVRKTVIVRNCSGNTIGTEFADSEELDKVLGMFLMS